MTGKNQNEMEDTLSDIVIIGGGLAGLSMAAALSSLPVTITIVESAKSQLDELEALSKRSVSFDDRALALSLASIKILKNVGVFTQSDLDSFTEIKQIHVSDRGHVGMLRMSADEVMAENLGRVVPAPKLGEKLLRYLAAKDYKTNISIIDQAEVQSIAHKKTSVVATIHSEQSEKVLLVQSKLVILADGGRSQIADNIGLLGEKTDYQQVGILANLRSEKPHQHIAYERFTNTGPIALLPLGTHDYKLVWTVLPQEEQSVLTMSVTDFLQAIQAEFGHRAGKFERVGRRISYPMQSVERKQIVSGRIALIGNAAHSLHPIAGQGFNLGLRDIACLAEIIAEQILNQADIGHINALMQYQQFRQRDIHRTIWFTDKLVKQFSTNSVPSVIARNIGLIAIDRLPQAKHQLMRKLMGVAGQQFKLLKGESLL